MQSPDIHCVSVTHSQLIFEMLYYNSAHEEVTETEYMRRRTHIQNKRPLPLSNPPSTPSTPQPTWEKGDVWFRQWGNGTFSSKNKLGLRQNKSNLYFHRVGRCRNFNTLMVVTETSHKQTNRNHSAGNLNLCTNLTPNHQVIIKTFSLKLKFWPTSGAVCYGRERPSKTFKIFYCQFLLQEAVAIFVRYRFVNMSEQAIMMASHSYIYGIIGGCIEHKAT